MAPESAFVSSGRAAEPAGVRTASSDEWGAVVVLSGAFDFAECPGLRAELTRHIDEGRRAIRVDLRDVDFMDSWAIGELVTAHERCRSGGSLTLSGVSQRLLRVLGILGLDEVLIIDAASSG